MKEPEVFRTAMQALHREVGEKAYVETYQLFIELAEWLIEVGWGNVELAAKNHHFSRKYRVNAVKVVKRK